MLSKIIESSLQIYNHALKIANEVHAVTSLFTEAEPYQSTDEVKEYLREKRSSYFHYCRSSVTESSTLH